MIFGRSWIYPPPRILLNEGLGRNPHPKICSHPGGDDCMGGRRIQRIPQPQENFHIS